MKKALSFLFSLVQTFCIAQTGILEDFNDNILNQGWKTVPAESFKLTETAQSLKVDAATPGNDWSNFEFNFTTQNISANPVVKLKLKNTQSFNLRIDLVDENGVSNNSSPVSQAISINNSYTQVTLNFAGKLGSFNSAKLKKIVIFFNAGSTAFNGTVYIDDLTIGDANPLPTQALGPIRINHIGYELKGPKQAILELSTSTNTTNTFDIIDANNTVVYSGALVSKGQVQGWTGRYFWMADFSNFQKAGKYKVKIGSLVSYEFSIQENLLFSTTAFSVVDFFKSMRSMNNADKTLSFNGPRNDLVNVYGGWWDATGDPGKHISHLSYANYFNPQQIPFVVWSLLKSYELDNTSFAGKATDLKSEAAWGSDYLLRNLDKAGYFYLSVFDNWGNDPASREICEWGAVGSDSQRSPNFQCSFREGGGISIAALARAYSMDINGDSTKAQYLRGAKKAYAHLKSGGSGYSTKNLEYDNDHKENIIDDYCALFAAIELYKATGTVEYKTDALFRVEKLLGRQKPEGYFSSDDAGNRPFFHGADEGMPIMALLAFMDIDKSKNAAILAAVRKNINWYVNISNEVTNPFSYVRQYRSAYKNSSLQTAQKEFFMPHDNETGYWWQGENSRISSLSTAFSQAARKLNPGFELGSDSISKIALAQIDWILGKNPFDLSMMYGFGNTTYPTYPTANGKQNIKGGICNGISSKDLEESNLSWMPYASTDWQNWRWIEQWLPHDCWYLLSVSSISNIINSPASEIAEFGIVEIESTVNNKLLISWSTNFEINGKNFEIQRSINGIDFTTIGTVSATGNEDASTNYSFTDNILNPGAVTYRIIYNDLNGNKLISSETSQIITSQKSANTEKSLKAVIYPNPFSYSAQFYMSKSHGDNGKIIISDMNGRIKQEKSIKFGENWELGSDLEPGVYTIEIISGNEIETQKLVKTY